jgi:HNH endonuclease
MSGKRDKRRLKNVFVILRKALHEADENDLIHWEKTFPIKKTYKTDGWMIKLGSLGKKQPTLELWIDNFPSIGKRCFWFGFYSNNKYAIESQIENALSRLSPKRVLTNDDFTLAGGYFHLRNKLEPSEFDQPIHEVYYKKYSHFGMFDATDSTSQNAARKVARRAATFFVNVLQDSIPVANDTSTDELPGRIKQTVNRIIRDTDISRQIKRLYRFRCQVCGLRLKIGSGDFYAEAHHLQPLGGEHKGPDVPGNLMCLCPNHHALFDYFAMPLNPARLKLKKHKLGKSFVNYHNKHFV